MVSDGQDVLGAVVYLYLEGKLEPKLETTDILQILYRIDKRESDCCSANSLTRIFYSVLICLFRCHPFHRRVSKNNQMDQSSTLA